MDFILSSFNKAKSGLASLWGHKKTKFLAFFKAKYLWLN